MTYNETIEKICGMRRFEKEYGVDITARLLKEAGIEEEPAPYIHVAGTNGKGSVIAMVDSVLREAEFTVGRFTSPHLETFCERIAVNGENISEDDVVRLAEKVLALPSANNATMFDICLMIAVFYFVEKECDFWLIETGLGGQYDSTNALGTPLIAAITSVGYDHEAYLGSTISEIAKAKAGIIKEDCVCVTGPQAPEVLEIIEKTCDEKDVFFIEMEPIEDDDFELGLKGEFQKENAGIAVGIINVLVDIGVKILPSDLEKGMQKAFWPGRMQIIKGEKDIIIDGAHNIPGMTALCESVKEMYKGEKFHLAMAFSKDKAVQGMLELVKDIAKDIVFTQVDKERGMDPNELCEIAKAQGISTCVAEDAKTAVSMVKQNDAPALICGSLYFVGEVLKALK